MEFQYDNSNSEKQGTSEWELSPLGNLNDNSKWIKGRTKNITALVYGSKSKYGISLELAELLQSVFTTFWIKQATILPNILWNDTFPDFPD